ncbi:hypothetical protein ACTHQ0_25590 [Priestia megaterium]
MQKVNAIEFIEIDASCLNTNWKYVAGVASGVGVTGLATWGAYALIVT